MQPSRPQGQRSPFISTTTWPISPADARPFQSLPSRMMPPPTPLFAGKQRPADATAGSRVLARYAALSGGAAFAVSDFKGLKEAATQIVDELKQQYRLGYDPPAGPARFRRIEVRTTRKGIVVKTRSGYVPQS